MPRPIPPKVTPSIRLADAKFRRGDVLIHHSYWPNGRAISTSSAAIAEIGRGFVHHTAILDWVDGKGWVAVEMVPPVGREEPILDRVISYPETINWMRVPDAVALDYDAEKGPVVRLYDRNAAVAKARTYIGVKYGFDTIKRDYLVSSWGRWFTSLPTDEEILHLLPVCSVLVLDALQTGFGGWDLVRHLNLALTQPEDVNRLCILEDVGALVP